MPRDSSRLAVPLGGDPGVGTHSSDDGLYPPLGEMAGADDVSSADVVDLLHWANKDGDRCVVRVTGRRRRVC